MHLLLIEDDPALFTTLQRSLVRAQMRVDVCSDGAQALTHWNTLQPDVVVLDLSLPGVDGLDVLKQARRSGLRTPVLILTARGTVGDKVLGLNAGADDTCPSRLTSTSWKPAYAPCIAAMPTTRHRRAVTCWSESCGWTATAAPSITATRSWT